MAHRHRDNLTGEHRLGDIGQLVLYCLFMASWISDMMFNYSNFLNEHVPTVIKIPIGVMLLLVSAYLATTGLHIVFGSNEQQGVIRKGVFRFVRHPIYLSEMLLYFGLLLIHISLGAACVMTAAAFFLHYISRHEEKLLLTRFPDEYRQYMKEVPMWFPLLYRK